MIDVHIKNMSCGHCQLKIRSKLEDEGYQIVAFDMLKDTVLVDTDASSLPHIKHDLDTIGYMVDTLKSEQVNEYVYYHPCLEESTNYQLFTDYLAEHTIVLDGFNDNPFGYVLQTSPTKYQALKDFLEDNVIM
ncbi:MAG: heavy-metal-associated domain-containing protein [Candidatus Izimaplasma sp.]|nr:heavy-metal-associated domain-containing protein [Candidatus Izimaplasma bacterium]